MTGQLQTKTVLDASSGRKADKETWWWYGEVQKSVERKRLAKRMHKVKVEGAKVKQRVYDDWHARLDSKDEERRTYTGR